MRKGWWVIAFAGVLGVAYLLGPHPVAPVYETSLPIVPGAARALDSFVAGKEAQHKLKPDNEARIVWLDSNCQKTPVVVLYLHGFSASQAEGDPVHKDFARRYGCNLYLPRLAEQGIDTVEAMVNLTADNYWNSAKEAYAVARQLGDSVLIVGTSTGGTFALQLAATYPKDPIKGLMLLSPNIAINNPSAWLLNNPWGLQIARLVTGSDYQVSDDTRPLYQQYWDYQYRTEAAVALEELLETKMTRETFVRVKQPTLLLYYYRDEQHQDPVVKVSAAKEMFAQLGTGAAQKRAVAMPNVGNHVMGSYIKSKDVAGVEREMNTFAEEVLGMKPR